MQWKGGGLPRAEDVKEILGTVCVPWRLGGVRVRVEGRGGPGGEEGRYEPEREAMGST